MKAVETTGNIRKLSSDQTTREVVIRELEEIKESGNALDFKAVYYLSGNIRATMKTNCMRKIKCIVEFTVNGKKLEDQ